MSASYDDYINVVRNDFGYKVYFSLKDSNGDPLPLSNVVQLEFHTWKETETGLECSGVCSVVDSDNGLCFYQVVDGDFTTSGRLLGEIEASFATKVITAMGLNIEVWPDLPGGY